VEVILGAVIEVTVLPHTQSSLSADNTPFDSVTFAMKTITGSAPSTPPAHAGHHSFHATKEDELKLAKKIF
jgi:hypothetical protein